MRSFPAFAVFLPFITSTLAQPPIPPAGLFCCPPCGPSGLHLDRQQTGPFAIYCYYSPGVDQGCIYDPALGTGAITVPGCPTRAPSNPHPPTCPI